MNKTTIREQLHQYLEVADDKKLKAIYTMVEAEIDTDKQRKNLIKLEREQYLKGIGKSYTPVEVKHMALNKNKHDGL